MTYEQKFEQLQHLILGAYSTFYAWKTLQNEDYNELYKIDNGFWSVVIPALQHEWFMGLARIFEESKYSKAGIIVSVHSLIAGHPNKVRAKEATDFLNANEKVIQNISRIRDHRHAHNNAKFLINPKDFEKRFSIQYTEIESIFEFTDKMLGILHPEDGHSYMLDHMKETVERETKDIIEGLQYFNEKRKEHREKWVKDGLGTIHFKQ